MRQTLLRSFSALLLSSTFAACGDDNDPKDSTACETDVTFTEIQSFSEKYCASCHADVSVPLCVETCKDHPLASEADWKRDGVHALASIDNGSMPLSGPRPSPAEVATLREWVKCEADAHDHEH